MKASSLSDSTSWSWSTAGALNSGRKGHGSSLIGSRLIVIGGEGTKPTEICDLKNGIFLCKTTSLTLIDYFEYPMILVTLDDFNC